MKGLRTISAKIALFGGCLTFFICLGLGLLAYQNGSNAVMEEVEQALLLQAEEASRYIDSWVEQSYAILETIARRPEIQSMDWSLQIKVLLSEVEQLDQFLAIGVANKNGYLIYTDGSSDNVADRPHIIKALNGQNATSDPLIGRTDNTLVVNCAVPIIKNNQVVGVLVGRRDGLILSDITDRLGFGENGWASIIGQDGTVYAHPERELVLAQENVFDPSSSMSMVGEKLLELGIGNTGVIKYTQEGKTRLKGVTPISSTGWIMITGALEDDLLVNVKSFRTFLFLISTVFVIVGIGFSVILGRQITRPLVEVEKAIEAVADGDLTVNVNVKTNDEIGRVAQALNKTIRDIREIISSLADATRKLADTSREMSATTQQTSASVEEVASTANQFSATLDSMSSGAQEMSSQVNAISEQANEGREALDDVIGRIHNLRNSTQKLAVDVSELGNVSKEVGKIVNVISAIAEQTNLLALNAAIEAARAGEHGRGFAVVAEEVRKLAEQSAKATSEITQLINRIQGDIASAVSGMNSSSEQAARAVDTVDKSGKLLHKILGAMSMMNERIQEISSGLQEVNAGGHEIASATEEQAASVQQVAEYAQDLADMGIKLQKLIEHFKLA